MGQNYRESLRKRNGRISYMCCLWQLDYTFYIVKLEHIQPLQLHASWPPGKFLCHYEEMRIPLHRLKRPRFLTMDTEETACCLQF